MITRDEEYVDPRAHGFFYYGYGRDGYSHFWNSTSENLKPTTTLQVSGALPICAYCGRKALSIQGKTFDGYYSKGYCCVCSDAMDEIDTLKELDELIKKQEKELQSCRAKLPVINQEAMEKVVDFAVRQSKEEFKRWNTYSERQDFKIREVKIVNGKDYGF